MPDSIVRSLFLFLLCVVFPPTLRAENKPPPNIVLIISDDQAWTDFGFMGHPQIQTPHLDRFARESLLFRHAYVPSSLCCPSLAAVLTGKYPHQTKVTGNEPPRPPKVAAGQVYRDPGFLKQVHELNGFLTRHPRLPAELGKHGYLSFQTGKWWAGNFSTGGFTLGMSHGETERGGRHGDEGLVIGRKSMQPISDFMDRAIRQQQPFMVWYAPMLPHQPHDPPERLLQKYRDKTPSLHVAKYWAMCERFDETCGELLALLEQRKIADNTIVVFMVDNGWIQDPEQPRFRSDSKLSQYDGGLRIPLLIRWPGHIQPRQCDDPVSTLDIAPTLYQACGTPRPEGLPGIDLLDEQAVTHREAVFGECFLHNAVDIHKPELNLTYRWCVTREWKLILPNPTNVRQVNKPGRAIAPELYQIAVDPQEEHEVSGKHAPQVERLKGLIDHWWSGT
ncbi:MAG: atsA 18 [Planctomycetaceae bacterium]|nr:atsA 18 [Planctomycetaceae bacterium]